jgi:ketosteroid isomerase-like protein
VRACVADTLAAWFERSSGEWDQQTLEWWSENAWHPDIEWRSIEGAPDDVGWIHGRERLRRYYGEWLELFEQIRNDVLEVHDCGERAVLRLRVSARARSTGMPLELDYAAIFELEDGKVRWGREYATVAEALAAAAHEARSSGPTP